MRRTTLPVSEPAADAAPQAPRRRFGPLTGLVAGLDLAATPALPAVLLHGVGLRAEAWGPQIHHLAVHRPVIALDLPGHGGSPALPDDATLVDHIGAIAAALAAITPGPVALIGHSMGGLLALGVTLAHPRAVARLAILNGVYCREPAARAAVTARAAALSAGERDVEGPLQRWFDPSLPASAPLRAEVRRWLTEVDLPGYSRLYRLFATSDRLGENRLSTLTVPALFLTGAEDPNSTPAMSRAMAAATPQGQAVIIPGERHLVHLTAPAPVNQALDRLLLQAEESAA